jgi:tRNA U34 5-methylaminomethyl-2-thiouridine-forming methyltransferase MnmC
MQNELRITADGSHTLYLPEMDETYHSIHGAVTESMHVFIRNGLNACEKNPVNILEIGFGTGLNAWLTAIEAEKSNRETFYTAYELFPLSEEIGSLNYPKEYGKEHAGLFSRLHQSDWGKSVQLTSFFSLKKIKEDITQTSVDSGFDLIYFDAFAPTKQPEMWTEDIFRKMFNSLSANGILVTYCAKGDVRRTLQKVGFAVEKLPGPPLGKREMLRGLKRM